MTDSTTPNTTLVSAISEHFRSIDSAPKGYAFNRPANTANGFYITFTAISLVALAGIVIISNHWPVFATRDLIFYSASDSIARMPIRLFFIIYFFCYCLYAYTNWWRRGVLLCSFVGKFLVVSLSVDLVAVLVHEQFSFVTPIFIQQLLSGLAAMAIFPHTVLRQAQLPPTNLAPIKTKLPIKNYALLFGAVSIGFTTALWVEYRFDPEIRWLRSLALLGGVGPGIFLVQQIFAITLASIGAFRYSRTRRLNFAPKVAVLVPAHNEAHSIDETIHSVDKAAETYSGKIHLYIVDNCSKDETAQVSRDALAQCTNIEGDVLFCGEPGKAIALNYGLDHIDEEFVVRIDADTNIGPNCLAYAMNHFADPKVGSVGGLPLPKENTGIIPKIRLVEVLLRHGFFQVALGGFGAVLGVPGMFAIYRHSVIRDVGGITEGMNGEDTDIVMRIHAEGYKVISDPKAIYYSETPASFAHLREQRLRWFRSIYHLTAHNKLMLLNPRLVTGAVILPFMLMSAARRAMLAPLLIYCILTFMLFSDIYVHLAVQAALALIFGMPFMMAILVCLIWRRFDALLYLPLYLMFRILRSQFTLASALTLIYPPIHLGRPKQAN